MRAAFSILFLLLAGTAQAVPVQWTIQNGQFSDGASLTGSFVYDADTGIFSDILVVAGSGSGGGNSPPPAWEYPPVYDSNNPFDLMILAESDSQLFMQEFATCGFGGCIYGLDLLFDAPLSNSGGVVSLNAASRQGINVYPSPAGEYVDYRYVISGSILGTVVPIPAAVWLFGSALAGLGWIKRKQTA